MTIVSDRMEVEDEREDRHEGEYQRDESVDQAIVDCDRGCRDEQA